MGLDTSVEITPVRNMNCCAGFGDAQAVSETTVTNSTAATKLRDCPIFDLLTFSSNISPPAVSCLDI